MKWRRRAFISGGLDVLGREWDASKSERLSRTAATSCASDVRSGLEAAWSLRIFLRVLVESLRIFLRVRVERLQFHGLLRPTRPTSAFQSKFMYVCYSVDLLLIQIFILVRIAGCQRERIEKLVQYTNYRCVLPNVFAIVLLLHELLLRVVSDGLLFSAHCKHDDASTSAR